MSLDGFGWLKNIPRYAEWLSRFWPAHPSLLISLRAPSPLRPRLSCFLALNPNHAALARQILIKFRFLLVLLAASLLWSGPRSVHAQEPTPAASVSAPLPPDDPAITAQDGAPQSSPQTNLLRLPALKAVVVVGPLDGSGGNPGPVTIREINNAELAADEFEANGVSVSRFYAPNTSWTQIQAAANGAHFFIYRGHGIYWGALPNPPVGGIELNERNLLQRRTPRRAKAGPQRHRHDLQLLQQRFVRHRHLPHYPG